MAEQKPPAGKPGTPSNPLPESAAGKPSPQSPGPNPSAAPTAPVPGHGPAPTPAVNAPPSVTQAGTDQPLNPASQPTDPANVQRMPGVVTPPPQTGGPTAGRSPQQMAEEAVRRQHSGRADTASQPAGFRLGVMGDGDELEDVTLSQFTRLYRQGISQMGQHDYWSAARTAGQLLGMLAHCGSSQATVKPMMATTAEHTAEHDDWSKCREEFQQCKGQVMAAAPQFAANPGYMQSGGPASGAAPGLAPPDKRTVGFDPNNIVLILQLYQTVMDMIDKFRHRS